MFPWNVTTTVQPVNDGAPKDVFPKLPLAQEYVNLDGLMVGCGAGEMLTVVHRATNSSVRRRGTSMVEYASIQGKV